MLFFFNDTATTEIYTLSLHGALPIWSRPDVGRGRDKGARKTHGGADYRFPTGAREGWHSGGVREGSEEHTSELQSRQYLVCRLLLEKKNRNKMYKHVFRHLHPTMCVH